MDKDIIIIGYSGHAYVVIDAIHSQGGQVAAYCDLEEKLENPYDLEYLGLESSPKVLERLEQDRHYFIGIGDNNIRERLTDTLWKHLHKAPQNVIHSSAILSPKISMAYGNFIGPRAIINSKAQLGSGIICNSGSIIEHECQISDYVHIAPNATLCGNVKVGKGSMVGAGSVIKEGIKIGKNVIIGAGTVVIRDIPDHCTVVGNPQRQI